MFYFTFALAFIAALPYILTQSVCPTVKRVQKFNLDKYTQGTWYEIGRAQNNWERTGDCVVVTYDKVDNNTFTYNISTILNNKPNTISGVLRLDDNAKGAGFVDFYSPSFTASEGSNLIPVDITAVDYDRYAIVYHCHVDKKTQNIHHYFWILGKTTTLDNATRAEIFKTIEDTNAYDMKHVTIDHFSKDKCEIK